MFCVCILGMTCEQHPLPRHVKAFNLDEYYPIEREALQSYYYFMKTLLFDKVDIDPSNCFIPDGTIPKEEVKAHCARYEKMIEDAGGIDLQTGAMKLRD